MRSQRGDNDIVEALIVFSRSNEGVLGSNRNLIALPVDATCAPELLDGEAHKTRNTVLDSGQVKFSV
jgi:hypothetical protein